MLLRARFQGFDLFAQGFGHTFARTPVVLLGFDRRPQPLVLLAQTVLQTVMLGHLVDELPHSGRGPIQYSQIPELVLAVPDDELLYALVGLAAPADVAAFQDRCGCLTAPVKL